ncbi:MAG TPA: NrsF family protein [Kofleriaceae bacterium]|nr:NrsF family protein [Kofleriaceae bacterium]
MSDELDAVLAGVALPAAPPMCDELERELGALAPVRARNPRRDLALVIGASLAYAGAFLAILRLRRDLDGLPMGWLAAYAAAWFAGFASLAWLAIVPPRGQMMPRWRAAGIGAVIASILFIAGGILLHQEAPNSVYYGWDKFHRGHWCLEIGLATAIVPATLGAIVLRGVLPVGSRWAAAALGAAGGSLGGLVLHLHCPIADGVHLGIVHGGVVLVSAVLAAAIAPRAKMSP